MSDIKKIVDSVVGSKPVTKIVKTNRTLSLADENFRILQAHCVKHHTKVSEVVDRLIETYLDNIDATEFLDLKDEIANKKPRPKT